MMINKAKFNSYITPRPYSKNASRLGFSSEHLYRVKIKQLDEQGRETFIPANVTRLTPDTPEDIEAIEAIKDTWNQTEYADKITENFTDKRNTDIIFAVEIDNKLKALKDRILCLARTSSRAAHRARGYNDINLKFIQASPEAEHSKSNKYKGSGEVLVYGVCKYARESGFPDVTLYDNKRGFYNRLEIPPAPNIGKYYCAFRKDSMNSFIEKIEKKYQIK